jgi:hypothetical protein
MQAVFVELPPFERNRQRYFRDDDFRELQDAMMANPLAGDVVKGTGGLRKLRWTDARRGKGKRGGLRIIYYYWITGSEFWLFTVYGKDEMSDLSARECSTLESLLKNELKTRA